MLRARAPVGQGLGGPWLLDGHEAFPLQALEHRERRRQQFTLLAVVPTPTCDRRLDGGDQELVRRPSVTRFHRRAADPGEPFIQKSPEPSPPTTGSPTTDSIRAKLIPGDSDDFRRSYSRWLSPTPRGRPSESRLNRDACPKPTSVLPPTSLSHAAGGDPAVLQDLGGHRLQRRLRISDVELGDDHHTLLPVFFLALPTVLGPPLRSLLLS